MKAVILAGGNGTRLRSILPKLPKPLAPVCGQPFIFLLIRFLLAQGVDDIVISTGYLAEQFEMKMDLFRNLSGKITLVSEPLNLGTGGALRFVCENLKLAGQLLVINGDSFFDFPLRSFIETFQGSAALAMSEAKDTARYGAIEVQNGFVNRFSEKPLGPKTNFIYAGFSVLPVEDIKTLLPTGLSSLEFDLFPVLAAKKRLRAQAYKGNFIDIGTVEDFQRANSEFDFSKYL